MPSGVVVQYDAIRDFSALDAGWLGKIEIQGVGVGEVVDLHGLNRLSRNALWIVSLSSSVMTRRNSPSSSGRARQKRNRFASCCSARSGASTTRMHNSFVKYGRFASTFFSKYSVNP